MLCNNSTDALQQQHDENGPSVDENVTNIPFPGIFALQTPTELFHMTSATGGGGKTGKLLCN